MRTTQREQIRFLGRIAVQGATMKRFLPLALPILLAAGCARQETPLAAAGIQPPAVIVRVDTVAVTPIPDIYRASGTVRARQIAAIAPKLVAAILEVKVHVGDRVQPGQTLIVLDHRDLEANLRRAEAARTEAGSAAIEGEDAIASARASVELARVTHKRIDDLVANALVSRQEFDQSQARLAGAEAALDMAISRRRQIEARASQADAEVAAARVALGFATLAAPFAGLVTARTADPGSLATPGAPLLTLERDGPLRLEASIDESRLRLVRIGERVAVDIDGLNRTVQGRVGEIVPSVDPATRTFTAKIDLPALPGLRAGMFARAAFAAGEREAVLVPQSAVLERGQIRSVHVVEGHTARLRLVTLGEARGSLREILSGLTAGDRIIVAPPFVADGGSVAIQEAAR
jgi:RND family efflux transporter MFP subunit